MTAVLSIHGNERTALAVTYCSTSAHRIQDLVVLVTCRNLQGVGFRWRARVQARLAGLGDVGPGPTRPYVETDSSKPGRDQASPAVCTRSSMGWCGADAGTGFFDCRNDPGPPRGRGDRAVAHNAHDGAATGQVHRRSGSVQRGGHRAGG